MQNKRKAERLTSLDLEQADPRPGPDQLTESRLELVRAMSVVQALSEIDRTAFLLRIQHGLPYEEIARILQLPLTTVKVKIHRARLKLAATQTGEDE